MKRLLLLLPLPAALLVRWIASGHPAWVERAFSARIYPLFAAPVGAFMSVFPFSVIEVLLVAFLLFVLYSFFKKRFFRVLAATGILAAAFVLGFGMNYLRLPLEATLSLPVRDTEVSELASLCERLADDANRLYGPAPADPLEGVDAAMRAAADIWPIPKGYFGKPKPAMISQVLSRLMIAGVTSPWTLEPLVNAGNPPVSMPYTALHEMAHARGFAREEDANLIAYLACAASDDHYIRYSGAVNALMACLRALDDADPGKAAAVRASLAAGPTDDLAAYHAYWSGFVTEKTAEVGAFVNNAYLQTVGGGDQSGRSYGRVVDLLLALERKKGTQPTDAKQAD